MDRVPNHGPVAVVPGETHSLTVLKTLDGYRFSVDDLSGNRLAARLTLAELDYEYPELRRLWESHGPADGLYQSGE